MPEAGVDPQIPIVCLVGPTGAGKTAASLYLADHFVGGVVNLDSRQVYRDFPVITAQPSPQEQRACPHRLYGFLSTEEKMDAGRFIDLAGDAIRKTRGEGLLPLLVGGTGLYLTALLDGLAPIPKVEPQLSASVQAEVDEKGPEAMYSVLAECDPVYASKIHPNDRQRIARALEVFRGTSKPLSWWHEQPVTPTPFTGVKLGIRTTLDELTPLLAKRIDLMLEAGAIEEAREAMRNNADPAAPGWSGIGCAEMYRYLTGEMTLSDVKALWLKNTRAYAKRQLTWFRKDKEIHWVDGDDFGTMESIVFRFLEQQQKSSVSC